VVDFLCLEERLVIELDGGQHTERQEKDRERSARLAGLGFRVLRFWNHEVLGNTEGCSRPFATRWARPGQLPTHKPTGPHPLGCASPPSPEGEGSQGRVRTHRRMKSRHDEIWRDTGKAMIRLGSFRVGI
jgi:hypothetical protein